LNVNSRSSRNGGNGSTIMASITMTSTVTPTRTGVVFQNGLPSGTS